MFEILEDYSRHGPAVRFSLAGIPFVFISDPEIARSVLDSQQFLEKGRFYALARFLHPGIIVANGQLWRRLRRLGIRALRNLDATDAVEQALASAADALALAAPRHVDLQSWILRITLDAACRMAVGQAPPADVLDGLVQHTCEMGRCFTVYITKPWTLRPRTVYDLVRANKRTRQFFGKCIVDARRGAGPVPGSMLAGMLADDAGAWRDDELIKMLTSMVQVASDVTATTAAWALHNLARHLDIQTALRSDLQRSDREAPRLFGGSASMLHARVLRESIRLHPAYAIFGRCARKPVVVAGVQLPANTELLMSPYIMHRHPAYWHKALDFMPDRWIGYENNIPGGPHDPKAYMPFASGPRACLGRHIALPMISELVARFVGRYQMLPVEARAPKVEFLGTLNSATGLWVELSPAVSHRSHAPHALMAAPVHAYSERPKPQPQPSKAGHRDTGARRCPHHDFTDLQA